MTPSEISYPNGWQVRWNTYSRGTIEARNINSVRAAARLWHKVSLGFLRESGIETPAFLKNTWEVRWDMRSGKKVWARNQQSKMPSARDWHWTSRGAVRKAGLPWIDGRVCTARYTDSNGYVTLTRRWMLPEDIRIAEKFGLFHGRRKAYLKEHRLVAVKKYNRSLDGMVVRHLNGIKDDNRPENLVLGTSAENTMDHNTARIMCMYWRGLYESLLLKQ